MYAWPHHVFCESKGAHRIRYPLEPSHVDGNGVALDENAGRDALQSIHQVGDQTRASKVSDGDDARHGARHCDVVAHQCDGKEDEKLLGVVVEAGHEIDQESEEDRHRNVLGGQPSQAAREYKGQGVDAVVRGLAIEGGNVNGHSIDLEYEDQVSLQAGYRVQTTLPRPDASLVTAKVVEQVADDDTHEDGLEDGSHHAERVPTRHLEGAVGQDAELTHEAIASHVCRARRSLAGGGPSRGQVGEACWALGAPGGLEPVDPGAALLLQLGRPTVHCRDVDDMVCGIHKGRCLEALALEPWETVGQGAGVDRAALGQDDEVIKQLPYLGTGLVDGGDNGPSFAGERLESAHDLKGARGIKSRCGLVEEKHGWVGQQLDSDADAPLLAPRAPSVLAVADACVGAFLQPELADDLVDNPLAIACRRRGGQAQVGRVSQGFPDGESRQEDILLHHVGVPHRVHARAPVESRGASSAQARALDPLGHGVEKRRLAGPAAANDGREGAGLEISRDRVQERFCNMSCIVTLGPRE